MSRASPRFKRNNPPLPLVGANNGVVVYKIIGSIEGQMTMNTFFYSAPVPAPTFTQLGTLLTNIGTNLFGLYKACISADWSCTLERVDVAHRNDLLGASRVTNAGAVGVRPAGHMPTEVSQPILRYSAVKGQHGRGRVSLPAISTADVTGSVISAAAETTAIANLEVGMVATASDGTNTWTPCVAQRALTTPKLVVGFSPLTVVVMSKLLGTVRRRKIGRGK